MRRYTCGTVFVLVAALAASPGRAVTPEILSIRYENSLPGMAEDAGWDGGSGGRHVTIFLGTPAQDVTQVQFNGVNVNNPGLLPVVTDRFDTATDKEIEADGTANVNAIRVEVPPRIWPLDTKDRTWGALTQVIVLAGTDQSDGNDYFQYLEQPVVENLIGDSCIQEDAISITWLTAHIPIASQVEVEFTGVVGTFTATDTDLTVSVGGNILAVDAPVPTDQLGEYDVTVTVYRASAPDTMSTSTYHWSEELLKAYVVHPPATIDGISPFLVPMAGNEQVTITGTEFHNTTGTIPDSGTEVRFDDVAVPVSSYDADTQHMAVTVPPCPDGTERAIKVGVYNFGSGGHADSKLLAYRDFWPTVEMLSPAGGGTLSGAVRLQADARDDAGLTKIDYWYAVGAGPHYHPTYRDPADLIRVAYEDGDWDPHADPNWWIDWILIGSVDATANAWPYTYDGWTPTDGIYTITAVAYDNHVASAINLNGIQAQTTNLPGTPVTITVNAGASNNPPVVTISSPPDGADIYAAGGNIFLSASATDGDSTVDDIQFWFRDQSGVMRPLGQPDPNAPGEGAAATLLWDGYIDIPVDNMVASDGPFYIVAEAITTDGVGYAGVAVNIVSDAATDVSISYITPDTSDYAGADAGSPITVTIYGSGFVDTVDQDVTVYFGGAEGGAEAGDLNIVSSTELTVTVPHIPDDTPLGSVTVRIKITDVTDPQNVVLVDSAERDDLFTVTDSDPQVTIMSPQGGADVGDGVVIVADAIDDKGITEVVFEVDAGGSPVVLATLTPGFNQTYVDYPYSIVWDMVADPPPGGFDVAHTITVTVNGGVGIWDDSISVMPRDEFSSTPPDNPPIITIALPATETVSGSVTVSFTVTDVTGGTLNSIGLRIVDAGTGQELAVLTPALISDVDDGTDRIWTYTTEESPTDERWDTTAGLDGSFYLIEATATDGGGNIGIGGVNVTVRNAGPIWPPPAPREPRPRSWIDELLYTLICGGPGCNTPVPLLVTIMAMAVPLLALRRSRRAGRGRAR